MPTVTVYTAARMKAIEDASVVGGTIVGDDLILTKFDASTVNAGNVRGDPGPTGPPGISGEHIRSFGLEGPLSVRTGKGRLSFPFPVTILGISANIDTAPTGAAVILDVNRSGTTIFTTQGNRPQIAIGAFATAAEVTNMDVVAVAVGQYITVDVDQIGSTIPGSDLTVHLHYVVD